MHSSTSQTRKRVYPKSDVGLQCKTLYIKHMQMSTTYSKRIPWKTVLHQFCVHGVL